MKDAGISSAKSYVLNAIALLALLAVTFLLAHARLGNFNTPVGLFIATLKALLVATYFMHLRSSSGLHRVAAATGVFWLGILLFLALTDFLSRGWLELPGHWPGL